MSFEGKNFIITGAAGAIAEPLIERLFSQNANLLLIDVQEDKLEKIQYKYNSDRLTFVTSDLSSNMGVDNDSAECKLVKGTIVKFESGANELASFALNSSSGDDGFQTGSSNGSNEVYDRRIHDQLEPIRSYVIGSAHAQGSGYPETWKDQPFSTGFGLTQIWKTSMAMDNTTRATVLKYEPNEFARVWKEKLIEHKWDIESSLLFGTQYQDTTSGNQVQYTQGAVDFINSYGNTFSLSIATKTADDFLQDMSSYLDPSTTTTYEEPWAGGMRRGYLESVANLAKQPMPIPVERVAGLDPMEMRARQMAGGLGGFTPYLQQGAEMAQQGYGAMQQGRGALGGAQGMYGQGTGLVGQGTGMYGQGAAMTGRAADMYAPGAAQQFYNPYEQDVVQQTMRDLREANQRQGIADRAGAIGKGAFGGSRGRLMEQERERSFGRGAAEAIGGLRQAGYNGAQQAAQRAGQGLGTLGGQLGQFGQGLGALGGQLGQFGQGLTGIAGQYGQLGQAMGGAGRGFAGLGTTGQQNLMNQIQAMNQMGQIGRDIQDRMYGAQYGAAQRMAQEPWQRMRAWGSMMQPMMPTQYAESRWGGQQSPFDPYKALAEMFGWNIPGGS